MKIILVIPYRGIGDLIFHIPLINKSPFYQKNFNCEKTSNAERLIKKIIILPLNEKLIKSQVEYITNKINQFYK